MLETKRYQDLTIYYRANSADERVLDHSFERDIFYPELFDFQEQERMFIIDVGAHIGTFSILSSLKYRSSRIISIEPNPESYSILDRNIRSNQLTNIYPIEAALNSQAGPVMLYLSTENWEHSITEQFDGSHLEVKGVTLQQIFLDYQVQTCDLIKMNCEGAEFNIILNLSEDILSKIKMILILYHEDLVNHGLNHKTLVSYLVKKGFTVRKSQMRKQRGWLIAKNTRFYRVAFIDGIFNKFRSSLKRKK